MTNEEYLKVAIYYQIYLDNIEKVYKNKIHGYEYLDHKTKEFIVSPISI